MHPLNIAVVGSGISGLSAAWLLDKRHDVTLFEADDRLGGHTNTVVMDVDGASVPVDTGFICFNEGAYPNLTALFDYLDVPVHETSMSFGVSLAGAAYEYSGGTYHGLLAQPSLALSPRYWKMIGEIVRFFREAVPSLETLDEETSLRDWLRAGDYSNDFLHRHLLPMAGAIWSSAAGDMLDHPAASFIRFFANHGLLSVDGRPKWGTVKGGAREYVDRLLDDGRLAIETGRGVQRILRGPDGVRLVFGDGRVRRFDQVVVAAHADQALAMLDAPTAAEDRLLGAFRYTPNTAVLHRDARLMPRRKRAWASWNYLDFEPLEGRTRGAEQLCLTYWMNSLQHLETDRDVFVTLNPPEDMTIEHEAARFQYAHPVFDGPATAAQRALWSLQGEGGVWYCGAHFGHGFHEDGLQSGLAVAEQLGGVRRPWNVANESGRIHLDAPALLAQAAE